MNDLVFHPCPKCGERTTGTVCFQCYRNADRVTKAREDTEATIPERFRWARLDATELPARLVDASLVAMGRDAVGAANVVFRGHSGAGKTSLAVAMARGWVAANGKAALFVMASDLATARMRTRFGRESDEVLDAMTAPLLVLDNLGSSGEVVSTVIPEVITKRHAHMQPLWVTTWMKREHLEGRYGEDIARRLTQGARVIDFEARRP